MTITKPSHFFAAVYVTTIFLKLAEMPRNLNKENFPHVLETIDSLKDFTKLKEAAIALKDTVAELRSDEIDILRSNEDENSFTVRRDTLLSELEQIIDARTIERAKYYVKRLIKGIRSTKTGKINDINLSKWKEYDDIITDSLWIFDKRDTSGVHFASHWGNFVLQIHIKRCCDLPRKGIGFSIRFW